MGGGEDVIVVDEGAAAVKFSAIGKGDQPRVFIGRSGASSNHPGFAVRGAAC